jgi:hypothetical protein
MKKSLPHPIQLNPDTLNRMEDHLRKKQVVIGQESVSLLSVLVALSPMLNKGFRPETGEYHTVVVDVWRALSDETNRDLKDKLKAIYRFNARHWEHQDEITDGISDLRVTYDLDSEQLLSPLIAAGAVEKVYQGEDSDIYLILSDAGNEIVRRHIFEQPTS